jgi:DNA-binding MarR family transcriptional regulator
MPRRSGHGDQRSPAEFGLRLKRAQHVVGLRVDECLEPLQLNLGLWRVLREVGQLPGASASELARASMHTSQTLGALLERLRSRGLIERSEPRGRVVSNYLTTEGEHVLERANAAVDKVMGDVLDEFSAAERATLDALMSRLITSLSGS